MASERSSARPPELLELLHLVAGAGHLHHRHDDHGHDHIEVQVKEDVVEKTFFVMKQVEELQPTRYRLENRVMAYVFVCVL
jgi:hypothetical protein